MSTFVDLGRRFRNLQKTEIAESKLLESLDWQGFRTSATWSDILEYPRVLILAEAGSGKTAEMREQARRLIAEGKYAFFVALESLDRDNLTDLLSAEEERAFNAWRLDNHSPAWFFLDAVDELKLTQGKLERALGRIAKAIDGFMDRARFVISSRPNDWRPVFDMATMQAKLPFPKPQQRAQSSDEIFLEALRKESGRPQTKKNSVKADEVCTVVMLPLTESQIDIFSRSLGVNDPAAFIAEIDRQNAWIFARRPLDLSELAATWRVSGRLGTRAEQHETNIIAKLKDNPERADHGVLSDTGARDGVERLALALALTRTRLIRSSEHAIEGNPADGVLDPAQVLPDWSEQERQALLRRAIFDPATYGRIRFHHRSVQEYLAAYRLKRMREKGMSTKVLFRFFFADRYGATVLIPTMREITAWLALWSEDVRREIMLREPEVLLSLGDPESLSLEARAALVRAFAHAYGDGGWRGLSIPIEEVKRLAHPELSEVILEIWGDGSLNEDVKLLLLEMTWQGAIAGCADIASSAAYDAGLSDTHRIVAVRALIACNRNEEVRHIAESLLNDPQKWPASVIYHVAEDLFPRFITVVELLQLVDQTPEPDNYGRGFSWTLRTNVSAVNPCSAMGIELRNRLTDLIRQNSQAKNWYEINGRFNYATPALALLCSEQLSKCLDKNDEDLISACVVANRFLSDHEIDAKPINKLKEHFTEHSPLRGIAFWKELSLMDELLPNKDAWNRFYNVQHNSIIGHLTENDRNWLETALADTTEPARRIVALQALIPLWHQRGHIKAEADALLVMVKDDALLSAEATQLTSPPKPNLEVQKMERKHQRLQKIQAGREQQRLDNWVKWRKELMADPATAFTPARLQGTLHNFYEWLIAFQGDTSRYNAWGFDDLIHGFGLEIAQRAKDAFMGYWRTVSPVLWSRRAQQDRDTTPWPWIYGLCGVSAESMSAGWATRLTADDARTAATYTMVELNGFSSWLSDLADAHPDEIESVLGDELIAEISEGSNHAFLPVLQKLAYADVKLKQLFAQRCRAALNMCPSAFADEKSISCWTHHLDQLLRILDGTCTGQERIDVATECTNRFMAQTNGPLSLVWLRGLFRFDPFQGTQVLVTTLDAISASVGRSQAIEIFAALFGDHTDVQLTISEPSARAKVIGQMLRYAYNFIRPEDDLKHVGVYHPNTRDRAETARNYLLSALLDTPGAEARNIILELAAEPDFAHFPDRLRLLARERAAKDSEFDPYSPTDILRIEERLEAPPHDRNGLFSVMMDRLEDLSHNVAHDDFTDRRTLRTISDEDEMQRNIARRLREMANGAYVVTREDEVADKKRTDIRLAAVVGSQKAVIEIKIADSWRVPDFERALRNQLIGQYLRHESCKAGCLLLTYNGTKKYWECPETNARLSFLEVVTHLDRLAKQIEVEMKHEICLKVHGLDLTDPILPKAHR